MISILSTSKVGIFDGEISPCLWKEFLHFKVLHTKKNNYTNVLFHILQQELFSNREGVYSIFLL